jgi:hypothetical protein
MSWTVERRGPVATAGDFATSSCTVMSASPLPLQTYECTPQQTFDPNGFDTGFSYVSASFEEFNDGIFAGGGTGFFFFEPDVFLTDGTYQAVRDGIPNFGSAGDATLIVSGISTTVPEPTSMALMTAGLFALGVVARRRRGARAV